MRLGGFGDGYLWCKKKMQSCIWRGCIFNAFYPKWGELFYCANAFGI